jgi:cytochrome c
MRPRVRAGARTVRLAVVLYAAAAATLLLGQAVSSPTNESPAVGDAVRGKQVFEKRCTGCHALDHDREGPHLAGVYGRTSGTVSGFDYSDALKNSHIEWREERLERWLTDPQAMFPGAEMDFFVKNPQERAEVIAFLKQQSGK